MSKVQKFTPWNEFRRYGYLKHDWRWICLWAFIAITLAILVPTGQGQNIFQLLAFHLAMGGFGATVFGFTILGGKDDFFEPIIREKKEGICPLRNMVLFLFFPLVLHGLASIVLLARIAFPFLTEYMFLRLGYRILYGFLAIWAVAQTYFSYRFLFTLAITRLVWKYEQVYKSNASQKEN